MNDDAVPDTHAGVNRYARMEDATAAEINAFTKVHTGPDRAPRAHAHAAFDHRVGTNAYSRCERGLGRHDGRGMDPLDPAWRDRRPQGFGSADKGELRMRDGDRGLARNAGAERDQNRAGP